MYENQVRYARKNFERERYYIEMYTIYLRANGGVLSYRLVCRTLVGHYHFSNSLITDSSELVLLLA